MLKAPNKRQDWLIWALLHIKKVHYTTQGASQCREGNLQQASMEQICAPEHSQAPLPTYSQQHEGSSKAASLLLETPPIWNADWSWSTLCSRPWHKCPSLNTVIILSSTFFEARVGVRLLMALKHFLNEAQFCSPFSHGIALNCPSDATVTACMELSLKRQRKKM